MGETSQARKIARNFLYLGMANGILAFFFAIPVLLPQLCIATPPGIFGCLGSIGTEWPGTWMFVAFIIFVLVGVLGSIGFAATFFFGDQLTGKGEVNRMLSRLGLIFYEAGTLGATAMMAAIGYVGGNVVAHGGGQAVAAEAIVENIIPPLSSDPSSLFHDMPPVVEAALIAVAMLGVLFLLISFVMAKSETGMQTEKGV
ncbi:MAG: hypothetical protein OK452_02350 [Thaumarchaeota archaeon]|nr:hypothetical protein [Nitrososphaerota archaeon]